jgi:hypothetical protein
MAEVVAGGGHGACGRSPGRPKGSRSGPAPRHPAVKEAASTGSRCPVGPRRPAVGDPPLPQVRVESQAKEIEPSTSSSPKDGATPSTDATDGKSPLPVSR